MAAGDAEAGGLPRSVVGAIMSTFTPHRALRARALSVMRLKRRRRIAVEPAVLRSALPLIAGVALGVALISYPSKSGSPLAKLFLLGVLGRFVAKESAALSHRARPRGSK